MISTSPVRQSRPALRTFVLALMMLSTIGCGGRQLMPTPNLYADAEVDPFKDVPAALQGGKMEGYGGRHALDNELLQ